MSRQRRGCRRWNHCLVLGLAMAGLWLPVSGLRAAPSEVLVVTGEGNAAHAEVVTALHAALGDVADKRLSIRTRSVTASGPVVPRAAPLPALVITVGTEAAAVVMAEQPAMPVFSIFLPAASFHQLTEDRGQAPHGQVSGLLIDQPFARSLRLIRLALPSVSRVGAVLGPGSRRQEPALRKAAAAVGLAVETEVISGERQLIGALHRLLDETDVLLAVPDALVFNRHTAQSVLLTANGHGKPVSGFSRAYVQAGALMTVYSTPTQIGRQAGEVLRRFLDTRRLPPTQGPRYFSVDVNEHVARSLGLVLADEETLTKKLNDTSRDDLP